MTDDGVDQEQSRPTHPARERARFGIRTLSMLFLSEAIVLALLQLPASLDWTAFAFMDQGANLSVQTLLDRGLVPTVDFGYTYGLLPLLIGRFWFGLLGPTPVAYAAMMVIVDLLIAWGLARCLAALRVGPTGVALVVATMPWAALYSYINLAHAFEATLICHALAEHASGRRPRALALLTACLFVKPVMAYVYGLLLVLLIIRHEWAGGLRGVIRALAPAAAIGVILLTLCGCWFGARPLLNSLLPLAGAANYRYMNYGFFRGVGRRFWLPENVWPAYYLRSPAGHYLAGTLVLAAAAAAALPRLARRSSATEDFGDEIVACCGIMHVTFLTTFYAAWMSWTYYYYILIIGLASLARRGGRAAIVVLLIVAAALVSDRYFLGSVRYGWRNFRPAADTAWLWAHDDEREEWRRVREIMGEQSTSMLTTQGGCVELLVPGFERPENVFVCRGIPLPAELKRKLDQVASARVIVIKETSHIRFLDQWPEFVKALDGCELAWSSKSFQVYRRLRPPAQDSP